MPGSMHAGAFGEPAVGMLFNLRGGDDSPATATNAHASVRVACHRGDWRNYVENSLEAVNSSIEMGADIVEVDIWRTKDGHFILMHDETVDRTTNGKGRVADLRLEEIRQLKLKDGLGNMTEFTVPTAEEALLLIKGRAFVNLDKADPYLDEVYQLLCKVDMVHQTILKSEIPYEQLYKRWGDLLNKVIFMPIINITSETTVDDLRLIFSRGHSLYEINFELDDLTLLNFIRDTFASTSAVLWVNAIWPTTCGGHCDDRALKNMDRNWGFLIQLGAGIIQTDRPAMLLQYLRERGLHD